MFGGIRHLIWDAGWMMEMLQVRISGWLAVIGSVVLTLLVMGVAL
jgi:succinate dehydrogenase / fumarate reductase cytochrome b subunit